VLTIRIRSSNSRRTLPTSRSAIAFARGARTRDLEHIRANRREYGVERRGEPGVAVPDQEPGIVPGVFQVHRQVPGLLSQPLPGRVRGHAEDADPADGVFDGEECI
jgi:hypothetical protein